MSATKLPTNQIIKMKKLPYLLLCLFIGTLSACGPTIYKANNFDSTKSKIKTLAIIPFDVSIDGKRLPKGTTPETLHESLKKTGYDIQGDAYTWLLQRQKRYSVTFQDVDQTNVLLNKAGINYENLNQQSKGDLCKLLNVDAVISGKAVLSRPISEGAAVALGILVGSWGSTNSATTTLTVHDTTSNLLWKYDYQASGTIGSSAKNLTYGLMRNASKKFPYKKEE